MCCPAPGCTQLFAQHTLKVSPPWGMLLRTICLQPTLAHMADVPDGCKPQGAASLSHAKPVRAESVAGPLQQLRLCLPFLWPQLAHPLKEVHQLHDAWRAPQLQLTRAAAPGDLWAQEAATGNTITWLVVSLCTNHAIALLPSAPQHRQHKQTAGGLHKRLGVMQGA